MTSRSARVAFGSEGRFCLTLAPGDKRPTRNLPRHRGGAGRQEAPEVARGGTGSARTKKEPSATALTTYRWLTVFWCLHRPNWIMTTQILKTGIIFRPCACPWFYCVFDLCVLFCHLKRDLTYMSGVFINYFVNIFKKDVYVTPNRIKTNIISKHFVKAYIISYTLWCRKHCWLPPLIR